jgi:hypothetical protein
VRGAEFGAGGITHSAEHCCYCPAGLVNGIVNGWEPTRAERGLAVMVEFLMLIILFSVFIAGLADGIDRWRLIKEQDARTERELEHYWGPDGVYKVDRESGEKTDPLSRG